MKNHHKKEQHTRTNVLSPPQLPLCIISIALCLLNRNLTVSSLLNSLTLESNKTAHRVMVNTKVIEAMKMNKLLIFASFPGGIILWLPTSVGKTNISQYYKINNYFIFYYWYTLPLTTHVKKLNFKIFNLLTSIFRSCFRRTWFIWSIFF